MKQILKLLSIIVLASITSLSLYSQENRILRIVRGKVDSTASKVHFIVGVAEKGSQVYVNKASVKQYETGSFGVELLLEEGENSVEVEAKKGDTVEKESFTIYYKKKKPVVAEPSTTYTLPVVVTKRGAYLNYGVGGDRLGGAKINFLAEGIKMELLAVEESLYKVRLSENRYAYIPKKFVEILPFGEKPNFSHTGSWTVSKIGNRDIVRVSLEERQPYTIYRDPQLNRIVVDIHGVACNSNWITQYLNLEAIEYVHLNQKESDVLSVIIKLKDKYSWGYSVDYSGTALEISVRHTPDVLKGKSKTRSKNSLAGLYFGIDAGHGGKSTGAVSPSGMKEKDLNLAMVYMLKEEIESRGGRVILSRTEDIDMTMQERKDLFINEGVDMVLSVHCNAGGNPLTQMGTSTYYRHIENRPLAKSVLKRMLELNLKNFGLVGNFNFSLVAPTDFPAILVETLFMSSLPEEEQLASEEFQKKIMAKVALGLEDYIKMVKSSL